MTQQKVQFRVYYEDTDAGGIAYHARYLNFAERGRVEAIRSIGLSLPQLQEKYGCLFVVKTLDISYERPLYLDDIMEVKTRLKRLRGASLEMEQIIYRGNEICARLDVVLACVAMATGKPSPIPSLWYDTLKEGLT